MHAHAGLLITLCIFVTSVADAQDFLTPAELGGRSDQYGTTLREVFARIYRDDVLLSVVCVPALQPEEAAGIIKTPIGYQALSVYPSTSIWHTEYYKTRNARRRQIITTKVRHRPLSPDIADRMKRLWHAKLLQRMDSPRRLKKGRRGDGDRILVLDSVTYYYSIRSRERGWITAAGLLTQPETPVWVMGELAEAFQAYSKGNGSEASLRRALKRAELTKA